MQASNVLPPRSSFTNVPRLVHLDLKGAPPKLSYLEKLFPVLRELGATGLLIEYEDTFPYNGKFHKIPLHYAYSISDIRQLVKMAEENQLTVIPLVQTFGHLEFVLKHPSFHHLREVPKYPNVICPCHPESMSCVLELVGQILEHHPSSQNMHIGADEVWHLGECVLCQTFMRENLLNCNQLFLWFITNLLKNLKALYPSITFIMWDDMLRNITSLEIKDFCLHELVVPMVWHYQPANQFYLDNDMWQKYLSTFQSLWLASAFKGATEVNQIIPPPGYHLNNQLAWLATLTQFDMDKWTGLKGIVLTGWQRFDHFTVLCELLPAGLPSLAVCLQCLILGEQCPEGHGRASMLLGFKEPIVLETNIWPVPLPTIPSFPGGRLFSACLSLANCLTEWSFLKDNFSIKGGFSEYLVSKRRTNPLHIDRFLPQAAMLLFNLESLNQQIEFEMATMFHPETTEEFLGTHVEPALKQLKQLVANAQEQSV